MLHALRSQHARLLSTKTELLPLWASTVQSYPIVAQANALWGQVYAEMIERVLAGAAVNEDSIIEQCWNGVLHEARTNWLGWQVGSDVLLVKAYADSWVRDFEEMDMLMNEFLVEHLLEKRCNVSSALDVVHAAGDATMGETPKPHRMFQIKMRM